MFETTVLKYLFFLSTLFPHGCKMAATAETSEQSPKACSLSLISVKRTFPEAPHQIFHHVSFLNQSLAIGIIYALGLNPASLKAMPS